MTRAKDISKIVSDANFGGPLDVDGETTLATHLNMGDGDIIKLGASADLQIYHDGSHSYVKDAGTGNLFLDSVAGSAIIRVNDGYNALEAIGGGAVNISHNGNTKIATASTGIDVTGNVVINGGIVRGERGTASAPPFTFSDDLDTGMFNISNAHLGFAVGGSERMRIDSTGAVTKPNQPAFMARPTSQQSAIPVGGSETVVAFGTEVFDRGADFASNVFTAPVEGLYNFQTMLRLQDLDSANAYYYMNITTSNRNYQFIFDPDFGQSQIYWFVVGTALADMDAGDTASIKIFQASGTQQTVINPLSHFSGYLVA